MVLNEIFSAICICCSTLIFSSSLQLSVKRRILLVQIFASVFYIASYFFVITVQSSALAGAIVAVAEIFRLFVFYLLDKNKKFNTRLYRYFAGGFFIVVVSVLNFVFWSGPLGILPLVGSIIVSVGMSGKNVFNLKISFVIQAVLIVTYLGLLHLWINMGTQVFVFFAAVIGLFGMFNSVKDSTGKIDFEKLKGK